MRTSFWTVRFDVGRVVHCPYSKVCILIVDVVFVCVVFVFVVVVVVVVWTANCDRTSLRMKPDDSDESNGETPLLIGRRKRRRHVVAGVHWDIYLFTNTLPRRKLHN